MRAGGWLRSRPARTIGPARASGDLHALWLYILAPIAGAALGALVYQLIRSEPTQPAEIARTPSAQPDATLEKELV